MPSSAMALRAKGLTFPSALGSGRVYFKLGPDIFKEALGHLAPAGISGTNDEDIHV